MIKIRILALLFLAIGLFFGYFVYPFFGIFSPLDIPFRLGLDLAGGTHLVYEADLSEVPFGAHAESLEGLRDVIERRVNLFGVSEPVVQLASVGDSERLIVEIAGVFDINEAIRLIGETPFLEFREEMISEQKLDETSTSSLINFQATELTGRFLERAYLQFNGLNGKPIIGIEFNDEGASLFEEITERNVGKMVAIFLDGAAISAPVVQEKIIGGNAQITGNFTPEEAKLLVGRLNSGALPIPIHLVSQQSIEASLGRDTLERTFFAGIVGFLIVLAFMVFWYRLPGMLAVLALVLYLLIILSLFKLIPITLSAAAIVGFILSVGMAVDANILVFERMKEEMAMGKSIGGAREEGFMRSWPSIRDSNISSLLTSIILWWFGTSIVKGFALTLGIGVAVSMFSALVITRTFLRSLGTHEGRIFRFFMKSGFA